MAMNVGQESETGEENPMSDINTTPLVDVMLVLLIIFLITVPVVVQTIPGLKLPNVRFEATTTKPENVSLSVKGGAGGSCEVYWGLKRMNSEELLTRAVKKLEDEIRKLGGVDNMTEENMPEAHIRADINTPYKCVGGAIYTMQRAGFARVGFISEPPPQGGGDRL